jgi:hypothetical protein
MVGLYIIAGIIFLLSGLGVRNGTDDMLGILPLIAGIIGLKISHDNKVGLPALVIMIMGITMLITGIFSIISNAMVGVGMGTSSPVVFIIIGIFFLIAAPFVAGNKKNSAANIIWIFLLILIILGIVFSFIMIFFVGLLLIISSLCLLLLFIYLLLAILSPEIKNNMGIT